MMNILEKIEIWNQFRFQFPTIICAIWVITNQRKLIWNTLKMWWSWGFWDWPKEKIENLKMFGLGIVAFLFSSLVGKEVVRLREQQQRETMAKMLEEKITTVEELEKERQKAEERERRPKELKKKKVSLPFYNISPIFCFFTVVIIAPIAEECVFRYLIFEVFDKNNPLAYIFSSLGFIFLHWTGGILNFTTIKILLLSYLPMTIFLIYVYKKSKWNIAYPIYFHFLWNFTVFSLVTA